MVQSRALISKYLTWDVGNGDEALFQEDFWDIHPPLDKMDIPTSLEDQLIKLWGCKVNNYKIKKILMEV